MVLEQKEARRRQSDGHQDQRIAKRVPDMLDGNALPA
jgi:hypothetical protein